MWCGDGVSGKKGLVHNYMVLLKSKIQMFKKNQMPGLPFFWRGIEGEAI